MFFVSVLCGLGVALGWGVGDFGGKKLVDANGAFGPMFAMQLVVTTCVAVAWLILRIPLGISLGSLALLASGSLFLNLAWFLFYRSLSVGNVSVMVAVYSLWVIIPLLWQTILGSLRPTFFQWLGMVVLIVAGICVSVDFTELKKGFKGALARGIKEGIGAVVLNGFGFMFINKAIQTTGWKAGYFYQQIFALFWVTLLLLAFGQFKNNRYPFRNFWFPIVIVMNFLAFISLNWGMEHGYVSVVGVVGNFSVAITVVLAYFFLRERLVFNQYLGIVLGLAGIISLSV